MENFERRLRDGLGPVRERFTYTLLDCPPSLGPVAVNALVAADKVIVPVQAEYLALEGLVQFLDTLKLIRRELNPSLELAGVVITIDHFGNLITNIDADLIRSFAAPVVRTGGHSLPLRRTYGDVRPGEFLALVNSFGVIEIARAEQSAAEALGLGRGAPVTISSR